MRHYASVTGSSRDALAEFVPRTAPMWAIVDVVTDRLVRDAASRSRQARAWMRFGGVAAWFVVLVVGRAHCLVWAAVWVVTVGFTILHSYRNDLKNYATGWRPLDRFVGWFLADYRSTPGLNPVGVADGLGCLLGGLITGHLLGSRLDMLHAFRGFAIGQAPAAAAAAALAAVGLIGGAAIVTTHFNWQQVKVAADRRYKQLWLLCTLGLPALIFALLWPGPPSQAGFAVRLTIALAAALATAFTCLYGHTGASRRIKETSRLVVDVKKRVREVDSRSVHDVKNAAATIAINLREHGFADAASYVDLLHAVVLDLQQVMEGNREIHPQSLAEIYLGCIERGEANESWTGVTADLDPDTVAEGDFEFIERAAQGLVSNARGAEDLELSLCAEPRPPLGSVITLEGTCRCNVSFDGTEVTADSGLGQLASMIQNYGGEFSVREHTPGTHTTRFAWTTLKEPTALPPAAPRDAEED